MSGAGQMKKWLWQRHIIILLVGLLGVFALPGSPVRAAEISWEQLTPREQAVLKPFKPKWDGYSADTKNTMRRWARLSPRERAKIKQRHHQWNALSKVKKNKLIRKLERYKRMPLTKRLKLKTWHHWLKRLPQYEQDKLHQKWPGMNSKQRKNYIRQLEQKYGKR